ncbi:MAG: hypothetical protein OXU20_17255, partial [Myxococcales bacterium]|nr:hypothetical protein [Myxococcales bacterium]
PFLAKSSSIPAETRGHQQGVNEGHKAEEWEQFLEFSSTQVATIPLPKDWQSLATLGQEISAKAEERSALDPRAADTPARDNELLEEMVALQETLDFEVYRLFGLIDAPATVAPTRPGHRPFEVRLHNSGTPTAWFRRHGYSLPDGVPDGAIPDALRNLEQPLYKRRWLLRDWKAERELAERDDLARACEDRLRQATAPATRRVITQSASAPDHLDTAKLLETNAVPFLAACRYTAAGLEKRWVWERSWDSQRREDDGDAVAANPIPPKFGSKDYSSGTYWRLRGKLDVPKERFISYPGCESDEDGEPLYGWAGWDHLQRAQALAGLYEQRKSEGWQPDRLTPMLAGLLELIPWLKQWHNEPNDDFDGMRLGDYFQDYLDGECALHGLSHADLRAWRPEKRTKKRKTTR